MNAPKFYETPEYTAVKAKRNEINTQLLQDKVLLESAKNLHDPEKIKWARRNVKQAEAALHQCDVILNALPQPAVSSTWLKAALIDACDQEIKAYAELSGTFIERFKRSPSDAIGWMTEAIIIAEELNKHAKRIKDYAENHSWLDTLDRMIEYQKMISADVLRYAKHPTCSTSPAHNTVEMFKNIALAKMADNEWPHFAPFRVLLGIDTANVHIDDEPAVEKSPEN